VHRGGGGARRRRQSGGVVNLKAFFVAALSSALDLGIAAPDDVLRHVTPDVLAAHLPRPLWARLLTACVGAPRVDAQLVVETIGVPNLCEHVPASIIWACIEELALRALGGVVIAAPGQLAASSRPNLTTTSAASRPVPLATPPPPPTETRPTPPPMAAVGPSIPAPAAGEPDADARSRLPPSQRFRQTNTGLGRLAANNARRPQVPAPAPPPPEPVADRGASPPRVKRGQTESDYIDSETFVGGKDDWKNALAVEDEQLVDWSAADETVTNGDELGRKR
jgi:hypothetical protein